MRKTNFINGECYHIYNRGTDKRKVFLDEGDYGRFLTNIKEFNRIDPIGSLYEKAYRERKTPVTKSDSHHRESDFELGGESLGIGVTESNSQGGIGFQERAIPSLEGIGFRIPAGCTAESTAFSRLVEIICYCLNPNHYHLILKQLVDDGISKFMHKVGLGYTNYFNLKNNRSGSLFQGRFKPKKITSDEHLLWLSAYVNGNAEIHGWVPDAAEYKWCSYPEYLGKCDSGICEKSVILDQFKDVSEYQKTCEEYFKKMKEKKDYKKYFLGE